MAIIDSVMVSVSEADDIGLSTNKSLSRAALVDDDKKDRPKKWLLTASATTSPPNICTTLANDD